MIGLEHCAILGTLTSRWLISFLTLDLLWPKMKRGSLDTERGIDRSSIWMFRATDSSTPTPTDEQAPTKGRDDMKRLERDSLTH